VRANQLAPPTRPPLPALHQRPQLAANLAPPPVFRWRSAESPLLDAERQAYLTGIQDGIASLGAAWHALTTALARLEKDGAARRGGWPE
jgi:hypothetical protein